MAASTCQRPRTASKRGITAGIVPKGEGTGVRNARVSVFSDTAFEWEQPGRWVQFLGLLRPA